MEETGQAWDPVTYPSRRHSNGQPQGTASEQCDPSSPSRWANVQPNDDVWDQQVHEDMTPLSVVGGVETGEAFVEGHLLACVSTSGVCPVHWAASCMALQ